MSQSLRALLFTALLGAAAAAPAEESCLDFKWDVAKERLIFSSEARDVPSGKDPGRVPVVVPDHLYRIALLPQGEFKYAVPPGKQSAADTSGGIVLLNIARNGTYRISLDLPIWVDVVGDDIRIGPVDYQEQRSCDAPHKILVFDLSGPKSYLLQLSGTRGNSVRAVITSAPTRVK